MKFVFFCCCFCCFGSLFAQEPKQKKFFYTINVGVQNSFIEKKEIVDYVGFTPKDISLGFCLGSSLRYVASERLDIYASINLFSFEKIKYKYYGTTYSSMEAFPQVVLKSSFNLTPKLTNHILFYLGGVVSFNAYSVTSINSESSGVITPSTNRISNSIAGVYPLILSGFGVRTTTKKGRNIDFNLFFHKGFIRKTTFELNRLDEPILTNKFTYQGTLLKFQVNWYINKI